MGQMFFCLTKLIPQSIKGGGRKRVWMRKYFRVQDKTGVSLLDS